MNDDNDVINRFTTRCEICNRKVEVVSDRDDYPDPMRVRCPDHWRTQLHTKEVER